MSAVAALYCEEAGAIFPESPHLDGAVENLIGQIKRHLRTHPHSADGVRDRFDQLTGPKGRPRPTIGEQVALVRDFLRHHNHVAIPEGSDHTRAAAWLADPHPVEPVDADRLRVLLTRFVRAKDVETKGIKYQRRWYRAPELNDHVGRVVEFSARRAESGFVDVLVGAKWISAETGPATPDARVAHSADRAERARRWKAVRDTAAELQSRHRDTRQATTASPGHRSRAPETRADATELVYPDLMKALREAQRQSGRQP
jgi:hypothetical protein